MSRTIPITFYGNNERFYWNKKIFFWPKFNFIFYVWKVLRCPIGFHKNFYCHRAHTRVGILSVSQKRPLLKCTSSQNSKHRNFIKMANFFTKGWTNEKFKAEILLPFLKMLVYLKKIMNKKMTKKSFSKLDKIAKMSILKKFEISVKARVYTNFAINQGLFIHFELLFFFITKITNN